MSDGMSEADAQELLRGTMERFFAQTREARSETSRVNRGITEAMVTGEDIFDVYERIKGGPELPEGEHPAGDEAEGEAGDGAGGE